MTGWKSRAAQRWVCMLAVLWGTAGGVAGEELPRPTLHAIAIDQELVVDGHLSEEVWNGTSAPATPFFQREPEEGAPASETTEVRVAASPTTLYVGVRCYDSRPERVVAQEMRRDRSLRGDDHLTLIFDTFRDRRNAYLFEINPNGALRDAIITDEGRDFNLQWDGIWRGKARRTPFGWEAELAIPFATLLSDREVSTWGFNVRRLLRHKNEEVYWSPVLLDANVMRVSLAGELVLQEGTSREGIDLQIKPFGVASTRGGGNLERSEDTDQGLDLNWGLTRNLTLNATLNTDFAETEVDALQVNLTRFSLFFPEKREFFLENGGIFDFGPGFSVFGPPLLRVFHSRRIGIGPGGEPVPVDWGGRLTGRVGGWSVGLLHVDTGDVVLANEVEVPRNRWSVARFKRNVGARSSLGLIYTGRDGLDRDNHVLGVDVNLNPTRRLNLYGFGSRSDDGRLGVAESFGGGGNFRGSRWQVGFEALQIDEDYEPGIGFLLRRGVRRYSPNVQYQPRPRAEWLRHLDFQVLGEVITDLDDSVNTVSASATLVGFRFATEDYVSVFYDWNLEDLDHPFAIVPGVVIPAQEHRFDAVGVFFATNGGRRVAVDGYVRQGGFFDGDRYDHQLRLVLRPSRFFGSETIWFYNDVDLPGGDFDVSVVQQRFSVPVNPRLSVDTFLQLNTLADLASANVRLRWSYRPGADIFLVYRHNWLAPRAEDLDTLDNQLVLKVTYLVPL